MDARKRKLHLGFHASRSPDPATGGFAHEVVGQRRLAHPGFPAYHQYLALTISGFRRSNRLSLHHGDRPSLGKNDVLREVVRDAVKEA
jgi:hypothetical protein